MHCMAWLPTQALPQPAQSGSAGNRILERAAPWNVQRGHDNTGVTDRVVNQLLTELDGVEGLRGEREAGAGAGAGAGRHVPSAGGGAFSWSRPAPKLVLVFHGGAGTMAGQQAAGCLSGRLQLRCVAGRRRCMAHSAATMPGQSCRKQR